VFRGSLTSRVARPWPAAARQRQKEKHASWGTTCHGCGPGGQAPPALTGGGAPGTGTDRRHACRLGAVDQYRTVRDGHRRRPAGLPGGNVKSTSSSISSVHLCGVVPDVLCRSVCRKKRRQGQSNLAVQTVTYYDPTFRMGVKRQKVCVAQRHNGGIIAVGNQVRRRERSMADFGENGGLDHYAKVRQGGSWPVLEEGD